MLTLIVAFIWVYAYPLSSTTPSPFQHPYPLLQPLLPLTTWFPFKHCYSLSFSHLISTTHNPFKYSYPSTFPIFFNYPYSIQPSVPPSTSPTPTSNPTITPFNNPYHLSSTTSTPSTTPFPSIIRTPFLLTCPLNFLYTSTFPFNQSYVLFLFNTREAWKTRDKRRKPRREAEFIRFLKG